MYNRGARTLSFHLGVQSIIVHFLCHHGSDSCLKWVFTLDQDARNVKVMLRSGLVSAAQMNCINCAVLYKLIIYILSQNCNILVVC